MERRTGRRRGRKGGKGGRGRGRWARGKKREELFVAWGDNNLHGRAEVVPLEQVILFFLSVQGDKGKGD